MFSNLRIWWAGWRQDYEGWWVRARRQGDSEDILYSLDVEGYLGEFCVTVRDKSKLLKIDDLAGSYEDDLTKYQQAEFASRRVKKAVSLQDKLSPRFRGSFWRHLERQSEYVSMGVGILQVSGAEHKSMDEELVMIYIGLDDQIWVRPLREFLDGRFVCINGDPIVKYGLVGAGDYAENSSPTEGGSPAPSESPTKEPGVSIPPASA